MPIDLYYISLSPPCRAVMMTAYLAGVDLNLKLLNLMNRDQLKPEFLKINPQHNVPTIVDDGFCLNESQAISAYLINRYGGQKGQHLYPEDAQQRAVIDQLLNFDASVLFVNMRNLYRPVVMGGAKQLDPAALEKYHDGIGFLDTLLIGDRAYAAGQHLTIADLALVASISSYDAIDSRILDKYPNVQKWFKRCQNEIPHYEELNGSGAKFHGQFVQKSLKKMEEA